MKLHHEIHDENDVYVMNYMMKYLDQKQDEDEITSMISWMKTLIHERIIYENTDERNYIRIYIMNYMDEPMNYIITSMK